MNEKDFLSFETDNSDLLFVKKELIIGVVQKTTSRDLHYNEILLSTGQTVIPGYYEEYDAQSEEFDLIRRELFDTKKDQTKEIKNNYLPKL